MSVHRLGSNYRFVVVVQLLSCVQLLETPWTASHQAAVSLHHLLELAQTHVH